MPKNNKKYLLERKVENQCKSIQQLLQEIEQLKVKTTRYIEQAHIYRGEKHDLMAKCNELEELLRQTENNLKLENAANGELVKENEDLRKDKDRLMNKLVCANERRDFYLKGLLAAQEELKELKKPWWKKVLHIG